MLRKIKLIIFLIGIFFVSIGGYSFAQNPSVEFAINTDSVEKTQDGYFYYEVSGWWKPDDVGNFFLILKYNDIKVDLCELQISQVPSENMYFTYPDCNNDKPVHIVYPGYDYSIYFSNKSMGEPISTCFHENNQFCNLIPVPENINEHDVLGNWDIKLKEDSNNYYYDIVADVIKNEDKKIAIAFQRSDGTGELILLNSYFDLNNNKFISSTNSGGTNKLEPGDYEIKIAYIEDRLFKNPIQTYKIGEPVPVSGNGNQTPGNGSTNNNNNGSGGGSSSNTSKISLVSDSCGYNGGAMCDFTDLMSMINRVINYIFVLVLPISAIIFAYAGYLYIVSAGDPKKREAAKNAMTKLVIGIIIIMLAWIIVKTILSALGVQDGFSFLDMRN